VHPIEPTKSSSSSLSTDYVLTFQVENSHVRGRVIKLTDSITTIINQHNYPQAVSLMLAEFLGLTVILASMMKYDGIFTLQIQAEGPIDLMVADLTSDGALRGYARFDQEKLLALDAQSLKEDPVRSLFQKGMLCFTVDQGQFTERYQSIVDLTQTRLTECVNYYFHQSEQFRAFLTLAVNTHATLQGIQWHCGGIVIQALPLGKKQAFMTQNDQEEAWNKAHAFLMSVKEDELLSSTLSSYDLLYRLFHEEGTRVFEPKNIHAKCRCSKEKLLNVLYGLDENSLLELQINNILASKCEFCGNLYEVSVSEVLKNKNATVH